MVCFAIHFGGFKNKYFLLPLLLYFFLNFKVKFMIIYADFERTLNWILSDEFAFCESSTFVFEPPSSSHERFITHSTPLFVYTDSSGLPGNWQSYLSY